MCRSIFAVRAAAACRLPSFIMQEVKRCRSGSSAGGMWMVGCESFWAVRATDEVLATAGVCDDEREGGRLVSPADTALLVALSVRLRIFGTRRSDIRETACRILENIPDKNKTFSNWNMRRRDSLTVVADWVAVDVQV
ncbi:hypothetical protein NUW54_g13909 [Trametes sanguinea]|uniref:Uncharacterized protein n=1 Tax=Trametes sanguinea TaxID=158606 RepID=A0ACC1MHH7_9APHY|nr:hypothetical protein NUW54_g13909 [Trametes sanguinea]